MTEFEQICRDYFQPVYRYIRRLSGDELLAEEITSETFFKALKAAGKFRGEGEMQAWLFRIARNCYFTHRKKARRQEPARPETLVRLAGAEESPEEQLARREDAARVRRLADGLPEPYREVLQLRIFGELSYKQIGELFGKTENWDCVTGCRARKMLRERWEAEEA